MADDDDTRSSRDRIAAVRAAEPTLSRWGFRIPKPGYDFDQARAEMTSAEAVEEFEAALTFLADCRRTRTITRPRTSYGWKHKAESVAREAGRPVYISNGMFLVAAIDLGFMIEREHPRSPNARLNIHRRSGDPKPAGRSVRRAGA